MQAALGAPAYCRFAGLVCGAESRGGGSRVSQKLYATYDSLQKVSMRHYNSQ